MKNKKWILLIIFSLSLVGILYIIPHVQSATPNIYFQDQESSKGTVIYVDNISYINNLTQQTYLDDLSTQRALATTNMTRLSWLGTVGNWRNLGYPLSPMDTTAFNRTQFYIIAQYVGKPKYMNFTVEITTFPNATTFNRKIYINSNATYYILNTNEYCSYCYRYRCDSVMSGFTRFSIKLVQSRWGVISKYDKTYYIRNAGFSLYENFGIMNKQISINDNLVFNESSTFDYDIFNIAGQNNIEFKNCSIYVNEKSGLYSKSQYIISDGLCINITNCYFYSSQPNNINIFYITNVNITNSLFYGVSIFGGRLINVNDTIFTNYGNSPLKYYFKLFYADNVRNLILKNSRYGLYGFASTRYYNLSDVVFKDITYIMLPEGSTQHVYLINCTSNSWLIDDSYIFGQFILTGKLVRSYTFELKVMNGTTVLSNANVKIYDKANVLRYSGTTNSNGCIPKQILDYCIWNASYQLIPYTYSNYRLNITKTGFRSIDYYFNNSIKLNYTINMERNVTTPLTLYQNIVNASGTHAYSLSPTGYKVWANYTSGIGNTDKIINATGTTQYRWNSTSGKYWVWANYTGSTTPVTLHANPIYAFGTLTNTLRGIGGWDIYANYTSTIGDSSNIINATGTHQHRWNSSTNTWWDWANYTGNITAITLYQNPVNSTGTHLYVLTSTGYKVWANYTGLNEVDLYDNIVNATGSLYKHWYGTYWKVWANYTGNSSICPSCNSTNLTLFENIINATGTHSSTYNSTVGWFVWANYTGNLTIVPLSNFTVELNFTGFPVYINWTGDYVSNNTNITFNVTSNMSILGNVTAKNSGDWLYIAGFDINPTFLLLSVFFGLIYLWWKSEKVAMMFVLAMLIVPYDIVVMIVYLLPLYITDANILLFMRIIFLLISIVVMGYTVDYRSKNKKEEKQSGE